MQHKTKLIMIAAAIAVAALTFAGVGYATSRGDDGEAAITGSALDKASAAALAHTGGGEVTDTEAGDEDSYYEVEVTMPDGREIDVQLDQDFTVVSSETDDKDEDEDEGEDEGQDD